MVSERVRPLAIAVLSVGTVLGYAAGFRSLHDPPSASRRAAFERHIASVCVDAANRGEPSGRREHQENAFDDRDRAPDARP